MVKYKKMFGVEYQYFIDEGSRYEIFDKLEDAENFVKNINDSEIKYPLFIFTALFNTETIYIEDDGQWNYEDCSDTLDFSTHTIIQKFYHNQKSFKST